MKLFSFRTALAIGGLLIATLAAGCSAGPGSTSNTYAYRSGDTSPYPNNSSYGGSYPYNSGYGSSYPNL